MSKARVGIPGAPVNPPKPLTATNGFQLPGVFWAKVQKADDIGHGCWNWTARTNDDGYGEFMWMCKKVRAHRLMLSSLGHDIAGLLVRHSCDNRRCVNPSHLLIGTDADNMRDRDERGRGRWPGSKGSRNGSAKLTEDMVRAIRADHAAIPRFPSGRVKPGELQRLAERHGLRYGTMKNIVDGYQWKHIL